MSEECTEQKTDIARLEERVKTHDKFIELMETNHLPHIYRRLSSIEVKMAWYAGAIVASTAIIQVLISIYK